MESLSKNEVYEAYRQERKKENTKTLLICLSALVLFVICLGVRYNAYAYPDSMYCLGDYLYSLWVWASTSVGGFLGIISTAAAQSATSAIDSITYLGAIARLKINLIYFIAGGALALGGAIFQTI